MALLFPVRVSPTLELSGLVYAEQSWSLERSGQGTLAARLEDRSGGVSRSYSIRNVERGDVAEFVLSEDLRAGVPVHAGDTLAVIYSALIDQLSAELQGDVAVAASELEAVSAGEKPEAVRAIQAQIEQTQGQVAVQERIVDRVRRLEERGLSSADELDRALTELTALQSRVEVLLAQIPVLEAGARPAERVLARSRLQAAQERLTALLRRRGALVVRSPIDGRITRSTSDTVLVAVVDTSSWIVVAPISVERRHEVAAGTVVQLKIPGQRRSVDGVVEAVDTAVLAVASSPHQLIVVRPDEAAGGLSDGLPVRLKMDLEQTLFRDLAWRWILNVFSDPGAV